MADGFQPDFVFRSRQRSAIPRASFLREVYNPIVETFNRYAEGGFVRSGNVHNIGALDKFAAVNKAGNLQRGDVLVYVANEYKAGGLDDMCHALVERGVVILPVFVGTDINLSHLTLLAETQKTGENPSQLY